MSITNYVWRLSGQDLRNHAFRTHGDDLVSVDITLPRLGLLECHTTACGIDVPVAFVLPHSHFTNRRCPQCLYLLGLDTENAHSCSHHAHALAV